MSTFSELLCASFKKHSEKTALIDNGTVTYGQLYHNAACIASKMAREGMQIGDFAGIYLDRSKEYITAVIACLLFGYSAVLLDIEYPEERTNFMLADSDTKSIVNGPFFEQALKEGIEAGFRPVPPDTPALVVYTSGSTGNPKGVLHDQQSVCDAILRFMRGMDYSENDICGSNLPYTFIAVGLDFLYPLSVGATVHVVPRSVVKNPVTLSEYIWEHRITAAIIPPKLLKVFKRTGDSLRLVATGSERVSNIAPMDFRIVSVYGMSEGFPSVSIFELDKAYETTPIGHGDGSLGIYLLDDEGNESDEGEICVSGHLFTKYLHLDEQTARVLVPNPFKERDGHSMLFHTNDMGKRLPDGNIQYVNRKDWMIKINGFRVEPGEVEANIKAIPQIFDCVVKGFTRRNGTPYLAAYYVEKEPIRGEEIRECLVEKHPYYMIPTYFIRLEALPVNNNGKLDHKALKEPETANISVGFVKPATPLQEALCKKAAGILFVKKIGIRDDLFALGANYEEIQTLVQAFQGLDESMVYKYKTIEHISAALSDENADDSDAENRLALTVPQRLTAAQVYYLDYQLYSPDSPLSSNSVTVTVPIEKAETADVKSALEKSFLHHPVLNSRIVFDENDNIVLKYTFGDTAKVECLSCPESEYESTVKGQIQNVLPCFNSLPYRCRVYTTEKYHHILFDIHYSLCDTRGIMNLLGSVAGLLMGKAPAPDYYFVYLNRMNEEKYLNQAAISQLQKLLEDDTRSLTLKKDRESTDIRRECLYRKIEGSVEEYARAFSAHHTPAEHLLIAAALLSLGRCNKTDRVAVSWMYNGRDEGWKKNAVGQMSASIPIIANLSEHDSLISLLKSVREQCNRGVEYAGNLAFLNANPGCTDFLQVEYADQSPLPTAALEQLDMQIESGDRLSNQLHILAVENENAIRFSYNAARYEAGSIASFADTFAQAFRECCYGTLKNWLADQKQ